MWIWNRFLAADSSNQAHVLLQSTSLWDQGSSEVISTLHRNKPLLGNLCLKRGWLSHPPWDRLDLTLCSVHDLYPQWFTCTWIVWDMLPWLLLLLIIWCEAKVTQKVFTLRQTIPKMQGEMYFLLGLFFLKKPYWHQVKMAIVGVIFNLGKFFSNFPKN